MRSPRRSSSPSRFSTPDIAQRLTDALAPVVAELGPREEAVLQRLVTGLAEGAPAAELNAFVRLLPVTVSRAVQPAIDPVTRPSTSVRAG